MRFTLTLLRRPPKSAPAAFADDFLIRADISEATVFLSGAEITRRGDGYAPRGAPIAC